MIKINLYNLDGGFFYQTYYNIDENGLMASIIEYDGKYYICRGEREIVSERVDDNWVKEKSVDYYQATHCEISEGTLNIFEED